MGDRRQDRTQAALGGGLLGVVGMGVLSLVLNQTAARRWSKQKKRAGYAGSLYSFVTRPSTKRDRAGVAVPAAVLVLAVPPPKSHGAARQLTMGRRALHTLITARIVPARHAA